MSDEASVVAGYEAFNKLHGRLDIMVNCAGIVGPVNMKTAQVPTPDFDRVYQG